METTTGEVIDIEPGADVFGSDGEKLGSAIEVGPDYLVVEKGLFFPTDYVIPNGAIAAVEPGRITLTVSKDEALNSGWDRRQDDRSDHPEPSGADNAEGRNERDAFYDPGVASTLGTVPPAADFATLGEAPVDENSAYRDPPGQHETDDDEPPASPTRRP